MAPVARVVHGWQRRTLEEAAALAPYMARIAAVGLPLAMCNDQAIAEAAQRLTDACLKDRPESEVQQATRELRTAFGLPATTGS
jgi:hypothetical protein